MSDESLEIDQISERENAPRPVQKPKKPEPEPEKPAAEAEPEPEKKAEAPEAEPEEQPAQPEEPKLTGPEGLRKAYEGSKTKIKESQATITKLEARIKELESSGAQPSALASQLKTIQEENKTLRSRLAENDYREDPDYQTKQKSFEQAFARAQRDLGNIEVQTPEGGTRTVTQEDIINLANLPYGKDRALAVELFGRDVADDVLLHTRKIRDIAEDQQNWVEENRKTAVTKAQEREAQATAGEIERSKLFNEAKNALAERYPQWFKPVEGDKEGNARLEAGVALTDLMFNASKLTPEQVAMLPKQFKEEIEANGKLSPQSKTKLHALIRNKAMNHDRLASWMKKAKARIKELETSLSQYEASEPGGGETARLGGGGGGEESEDAEIDRLSRQGR